MRCLARLFSFCGSKRDLHKEEEEDFELPTLTPPLEQTSASPMPTHAPHRPRYHYATLTPRMLAPFSPTAEFALGGDVRKPLHTFSVVWGHAPEPVSDSQDIIYEFIYEGECGITWPLRRIRVDNRAIEHQENEESLEEEVYDAEYEADIDEDEASAASPSFSLTQDASTQTPRKLRISVRRSSHKNETPHILPQRFKFRIRTSEELETESMRPLPRRRGVLVLRPVSHGEGGEHGQVYNMLRRKAATAPCGMVSETRKDSGVEGR
jgi:hypothetical protein